MARFQRELLPPPRTFYAKELGKLSRPSRGWAQGNCPFHESKSKRSFSVNLDTGGFYCHGCQAHGGDVLAFTMQRYRLHFKDAARELGAWDEAGKITRSEIERQRRKRERRAAEEAAKQEAERNARVEAANWLLTLKRIYDCASKRLSQLRSLPESEQAQSSAEIEQCWQLMSDYLPEIQAAEQEYSTLAGLAE
jgi:DNA primase